MPQPWIQRVLDVVLGAVALVVLAPVMAVVAILVHREDGGPSLFRQPRAGRHGQPFTVIKFRSMRVRPTLLAPAVVSPTVVAPTVVAPTVVAPTVVAPTVVGAGESFPTWVHGVPDDFVFKTADRHDPDVTRVGGHLRRLSLDELPQLVNVLRGEMSLVGPRPEILPIAACYDQRQRRRLEVRPGVTGWAQVNGRSECDHGTKISADLYWVEHASLRLYLAVLLRTVVIIASRRGAV